MKPEKKPVSVPTVHQPTVKQTSGDKAFDSAIDKMLKKPSTQAHSK